MNIGRKGRLGSSQEGNGYSAGRASISATLRPVASPDRLEGREEQNANPGANSGKEETSSTRDADPLPEKVEFPPRFDNASGTAHDRAERSNETDAKTCITSNSLRCFENPEFGILRVVKREGGVPWFMAKDVCRALEIQNTSDSVRKELEEDEKGIATIYTLGGTQELLTISEPGLYTLIFRSRKPGAKRFQKWLAGVVLPSIRKHSSDSLQQATSAGEAELPTCCEAHLPAITNDMSVFDSPEFGSVRVAKGEDGEPWFVAKDVCRVLELGNVTEATRSLDEDERGSGILNLKFRA
jgi:prophage antirepressor-like protein